MASAPPETAGLPVAVHVRVRPLNSRELELKSGCCLAMKKTPNGESTTISNGCHTKTYTFDHSFWSFDQQDPHFVRQQQVRGVLYCTVNPPLSPLPILPESQRMLPQIYLFLPPRLPHLTQTRRIVSGFHPPASPTSPTCPPTRQVFETVGIPVVDNIFEGVNSTIFAYGQTGSGKTYCMMGASEGEHRGIIPRLCEELYQRIELDFSYNITVEMQYYEIYYERVFDLLARQETKGGKKKDAKVPPLPPSPPRARLHRFCGGARDALR